ncbi:MAG: radical SAM protein [Candidatus Daviesbacteria bacterium]
MKIVLVRPNYSSHIITPPLGIGYLSSYLKKQGINVKIIDALKENLSLEDLILKIFSQKPDVVGITCLTAFYKEVVTLSRALKEKDLKVIIGGVHPTFLPFATLEDSKADFIICGEGEQALAKLLKNNFKTKNIAGVYSQKDIDKQKIPQKAIPVENLDDLPFPDWLQLNPNSYPKAPHGAVVKKFPIGVIMTTRGCPYQCTFCASRRFYDCKIRFRTPENVIKEIKYLIKNYGVKEIQFEDDNLTLKREHVEKICNLIIKNKLKISWTCPNGIRADRVDELLLRLMKKAGCYFIAFGVESANKKILKNVRKLESIETIKKAIELAHKIGIECQGFFIFGLPGETRKSIQESIEFAKNSKLTRAHFMILDILPGSELWDTLQGKFKPNWEKNSYKEPEWMPKGLSKKNLMDAQTQAIRQFYFRPITFLRLARRARPQQIRFIWQRIKDYRLLTFFN